MKPHGYETEPKLNAETIGRGLNRTLRRYQVGLIDISQARQELALSLAMLKAHEQAVLEKKLERLEAVLEIEEAKRHAD